MTDWVGGIARALREREEMIAALRDAVLQIEHLDPEAKRGTTVSTLARLNYVLDKVDPR